MGETQKRILFSIFLGVLVLGIVEASSFVFFRFFGERFTFFDLTPFTEKEQSFERLVTKSQRFHPELGWDQFYETPYGERPRFADHDRE